MLAAIRTSTKRFVSILAFCYGCAASVASLLWLGTGLASFAVLPGFSLWMSLFVVHACVVLLTFHRHPTTQALWAPVLRVTPRKIRIAKILLGFAIVNVIGWYTSMFLLARTDRRLADWALIPLSASWCLLNGVYIAIHWGVRPENIFSRDFLTLISNPLGDIALKLLRKKRDQAGMSGLLYCTRGVRCTL